MTWTFLKPIGLFALGLFVAVLLFFFMMVATDAGDNLVLVEDSLSASEPGNPLVVGTIENRTDEPDSHVRATITLLNDDSGFAVFDI